MKILEFIQHEDFSAFSSNTARLSELVKSEQKFVLDEEGFEITWEQAKQRLIMRLKNEMGDFLEEALEEVENENPMQ